MAILDIVKVGDDILRQKAEPVNRLTKRVQKLIKDMIDTMYEADGVGLAAPQIGVSQRIIVIDVGEGPITLVNSEIVETHGEEVDVEGCLSVPDKRGYVKRAEEVIVTGYNEKGSPVKYRASGLLARVVQHEVDHLDGVLFVDKMIDEVEDEEEKGV